MRRISRSRSPAQAKAPVQADAPAQARYEGSRGAEIVRGKAEGDARADGVVTYSEVGASPDNEASKKAPHGVLFCGLAIYARESSRSRNFARQGAPEQADERVLSYAEVACG